MSNSPVSSPKVVAVPASEDAIGQTTAAFVAMICPGYQPYLDYDQPLDCPRDAVIPRVLLLARWDGLIGFPGGFVEPGETARVAALREAEEEVSLRLESERLFHVCGHRIGDFVSQLYAVEMAPSEFRAAVAGARAAQHYDAEVCGILTPNLVALDGGRGVAALRRLPWAGTAGVEFDVLLRRIGLQDV